jgi:hypothetical protein
MFVITKDHIGDFPAVGVVGPRSALNAVECSREDLKSDVAEKTIKAKGQRFKMYDDDGELYYEGYFLSHSEESDEFEPLTCFGAPNAGATEIRYKNPKTNKFETL